jgi:hypothetical protein
VDLLTIAVGVMSVIAQLRRRRLRLRHVPTGRIVENNLRPTVILGDDSGDAKLSTAGQ